MKTGSNVKYVLRLALTLLIITSVVAALLAAVNSVTKPIIDQLNAEKTQKAIEAVLPGGGESIDFTDDSTSVEFERASVKNLEKVISSNRTWIVLHKFVKSLE